MLDTIENLGFKAFLVGGYVRDYIWGIMTNDIDICTNAPSKVLLDVFSEYKPKQFKYDSLKFSIDNLHFDISRIRKEAYQNGNLIVTYTNSIYDDYLRRDFTFNGIYMNKRGYIFTFDDSYDDAISKRISFIGNSYERISEDPSRLLRYIYISLKNDLTIDDTSFSNKLFMKYIKDKNNCYIVNYYLTKIRSINKPELLRKYLTILGLSKKCEMFLID